MSGLITEPTDDVRAFMARDHRLFIDGAWVDPGSDRLIEVENPSTEEVIARLHSASMADLDRAVAAARAALDGPWGRMPPADRARLLYRLADLMEAASLDLGQLSTLENGMPLWMSMDKLAAFCPELVRYYAGWCTKVTGDTLPAVPLRGEANDWLVYTLRQPVGVVGAIIPWNAPASMITLKTAPALAAGCTMVLKPAEMTPLLAIRFTELVDEAGFPKGVFNMVHGTGSAIGDALTSHPEVDMISFTGSTRAGIQIAKAAADTIKRVAQELGGKSANIVFADSDLEASVTRGVLHCFGNTGQSCNAPTRMLIEQSVYDEAVAIAARVAKDAKLGDPMEKGSHYGPVVSKAHFDKIQGLIQAGIDEGAQLVAGGTGRADGFDRGFYVKPTVFAGVHNKMRIAQEEVFGPVLVLIPFADEADAIAIANDSPYGLYAYVQTGDIARARRISRMMRAGGVSINGTSQDYMAPFGGYKQSGNGREYGEFGVRDFLEIKSISGFRTS